MAFYGAQMQRTQSGVIPGTTDPTTTAADNRIIFDSNIISGANIVDHDRGLFTISSSGNYYVSWFITLRTGLGDSGVHFSMIEEHFLSTNPEGTSKSKKAYPSTNSMKTGQLAGSAILQIPEGEICRLGLYNTSTSEATLATNADGTDMVNANITIVPYVVGSYSSSYGLIGMTLTLDQESTEGTLLGHDAIVKFNKSETSTPSVFTYDATQGIITTTVAGNYMVNWSVNLDGSEDVAAISFSIKSAARTLATFDSTLLMQNSYSGFAFITTTANESFWLVNSSKTPNNLSASVTFSNIATRAKLRIVGHS